MSKNIILKVEDVSKQYRLGQVGTGTISHDLNRWWHQIRGKENPYLKIGDTNDRSISGSSDYVWALQDINFEVQQGEVLGIIGKNGAGKSTLLKVLSKVTSPTTGNIKSRGRIASLLEVGTGFHPELTGRENIFLNGAILGMNKNEIVRKLDEIIDFSGVERYIDTPVKRYSTGMYVRLAFAVAANLESEILIVDEVLAVGDAEFQKKCLGKMGDLAKGDGRTILFVSHNMAAVKSLCTKGIVLDKGLLMNYSSAEESINYYSTNSLSEYNKPSIHKSFSNKVEVLHTELTKNNLILSNGETLYLGDKIQIVLTIKTIQPISDLSIAMDILNINSELMVHITNEDDGVYIGKLEKNQTVYVVINTDSLLFIPGLYSINLWLGSGQQIDSLYTITNFFNFQLEQSTFTKRTRPLPKHSKMYLPSFWDYKIS